MLLLYSPYNAPSSDSVLGLQVCASELESLALLFFPLPCLFFPHFSFLPTYGLPVVILNTHIPVCQCLLWCESTLGKLELHMTPLSHCLLCAHPVCASEGPGKERRHLCFIWERGEWLRGLGEWGDLAIYGDLTFLSHSLPWLHQQDFTNPRVIMCSDKGKNPCRAGSSMLLWWGAGGRVVAFLSCRWELKVIISSSSICIITTFKNHMRKIGENSWL